MLDRRAFLGVAPLAPLAFGIFKPEELKKLPKGKYLVTVGSNMVSDSVCREMADVFAAMRIEAAILRVSNQNEPVLVYKLE